MWCLHEFKSSTATKPDSPSSTVACRAGVQAFFHSSSLKSYLNVESPHDNHLYKYVYKNELQSRLIQYSMLLVMLTSSENITKINQILQEFQSVSGI